MKQELQKKLFEAFPYLYREKDLPMTQTCMCWGIECGDGWFDLLWQLSLDIQAELDKPGNEAIKEQFAVSQVKEKFGTLRFYISGGNSNIDKLVNSAEKRSGNTCEKCGSPGFVRGHGWLVVECDKCHREKLLNNHLSK